MAQKWASGGKACTSNTYPKGRAMAFADGGFVGGLASGVQAGMSVGGDDTGKKRKWKNPLAGTTGTEGTAASSTSTGENLPSILKPEGNT